MNSPYAAVSSAADLPLVGVGAGLLCRLFAIFGAGSAEDGHFRGIKQQATNTGAVLMTALVLTRDSNIKLSV